MKDAAGDIALYVHWPFCLSLCPYCDFNSHVRDTIDQGAWRDALLRELEHCAAQIPGRRLTSIFFGGGTPSLMPPETARAVIARARELFVPNVDLEITLEANPTSVEQTALAGFADAGINRLSLGIQALDDAALSALGRTHAVSEARAAIATAADIFDRFSFDLIYARPGQTPDAWMRELDTALSLTRGHLSVYQLTIEAGTPFFLAQARGDLQLPDEADGAAMFEQTQDALAVAGLPAYEISNHAAPGQESRHNLTYWHYRDYLGVGPGAHGRITIDGRILATRQHRAPEIWLKRALETGHATQDDAALPPETLTAELVMMGLRLTAGIDAGEFARRIGKRPGEIFAPATIDRLVDAGYLDWRDDGFNATAAGRQRLNAVVDALLNS
ncbi:MAG: radical SAM family heme chaperone HemW [Proteobacteria bacterium]|nr:radical SAM family heme chaperone HemW [Pseudomonadota bacterium]